MPYISVANNVGPYRLVIV